ncbi:uroporphyrinogen-III C-methyltransferase [Thermostilla marina]
MPPHPKGILYLVGAGPGDPGLLTLRGLRCLQQADLVLYDYLVNPALLRHASGAEKIALGHHSVSRCMTQDEINAIIRQAIHEGKNVVRLKSGDPSVFGKSADEAVLLRCEGIPIEVVPGITAGFAVGAFAGIPLTHAECASAVALVAGQQSTTHDVHPLDYRVLAQFPGTLIVYMGVRSAETWSRALIGAGRDPATPVAVVHRCSWPNQSIVRTTLSEVAEKIRTEKIRPPAVIVIGEAVGHMSDAPLLQRRPLFARTILVTRPRHQSDDLIAAFEDLGAWVFEQPAIDVVPPPDWAPVDETVAHIDRFDWLVFSSANGVNYFLGRLLEIGRDVRCLAGLRIAAIGPGTAAALERFGLHADLVPATYRAENLAQAVADRQGRRGRALLVRASRGRDTLPTMLSSAGLEVEQVVAYQSVDVTAADPEVLRLLELGAIDWVTVTSSAIARSLVRLFGERLRGTRLAAISPLTGEVLRELGYPPAVEARTYTMEGLVEAVLEAEAREVKS